MGGFILERLTMIDIDEFHKITGGFDTTLTDPNVATQGGAQGTAGGIAGGMTDFFGGLAGLFNNGVDIYKSVAGQWNAAKQINSDSKTATPTVIVNPAGSFLSTNNLIKIGVIGGVAIIALLLIRKK
jgi:hypothetical protein